MEGHNVLVEVEIPRVEPRSLAERSAAGRSPGPGHGRRTRDFLGGVFAMLLLPLSIVPVLLLGPSVLRAPVALGREAWGDVQHLERRLLPPSPRHRSGIAASELSRLPAVSLGPVYGHWMAFPQTGRTRPGNPLLGPEDRTR
jgi:hypothetical protein